MMATVSAVELGGGPGSSRPGSPAPCRPGGGPSEAAATAANFSVLVLVGALRSGEPQEQLLQHIEAGVRCWPVDLDVSILDQQLKLFVSRHSAFLSEHDPGQRTLQHCGDVLDTQVVLNPTHDLVCSEVRRLLCARSQQKLLVLAGSTLEEGGDLLLQTGCFSPHHLLNICTELQVVELLSHGDPAPGTRLTLSCPHPGPWRACLQQHSAPWLQLQVAPPALLPQMEGLQEFTEYLSECLEPPSPFDLLEPPAAAGFLRLWRPCCYVFPGGRGHAAFLAVSGFNLLLDGGSDPRPTFWKLLRHLERVDGLLLTHLGEDNLPAVNSLLLRKVAERECAASDLERDDWAQDPDVDPGQDQDQRPRRLLSPELGLVFLNAPATLRHLLEEPCRLSGPGQAALTLRLLDQLDLQPETLVRTSSQPLLLFSKMGVGRLEMFVLNPVAGSTSLDAFLHTWPEQRPAGLPLACLVSTCVLLVWHPARPLEKIVRLLFPGFCPQNLILDSLEKLQHLDFLRQPTVCLKDLQDLQEPRTSESRENLKTSTKTGSDSLKDKMERAEGRKLEPKAKTRPLPPSTGASGGEGPPREKKDGEKSKPKEPELKSKSNKLSEKIQKKDLPKVDKKDDKKDEKAAVEKKKEAVKKEAPSLKVKKEKPQARKDGKKEPKPEENKVSKVSVKEVKKSTSSTAADVRRPSSRSGTLKKDGSLQKKPRGTRELDKSKETESSKVSTPEDLTSELERLRLEEEQAGAGGAAGEPGGAAVEIPVNSEVSLPSSELDGSAAGEPMLPLAGDSLALHHNGDLSDIFSRVPHDVDLCLVTPCEFQHPKTSESLQHLLQLQPPGPTTSNTVSCTSTSSSTSASSSTIINNITLGSSPQSEATPPTSSAPPGPLSLGDPPPAPLRDLPPLPPQPGACMVEPEGKNLKASASRTRKPPGAGQKVTSEPSKAKVGVASGSLKVTPTLESRASGRSSLGGSRVGNARPPSSGSRAAPPVDGAEGAVFCVDLVYLPGGAALSTVDSLFFRRVRSSHYVISGDDGEKSATLRKVLDALLEAKSSWPEQQVTLIPTFDPVAMHDWYQETLQQQQQQRVIVLGSNSTVAMQDTTFPACKVQF